MRPEPELLATYARLRTLNRRHKAFIKMMKDSADKIMQRIKEPMAMMAFATDRMREDTLLRDQAIQLATAQSALSYAIGRNDDFINVALDTWENWLAQAEESFPEQEANVHRMIDANEAQENEPTDPFRPAPGTEEPDPDDVD